VKDQPDSWEDDPRASSDLKRARPRSGAFLNPRRKLTQTAEAFALQDMAAKRAGEPWSEWARERLMASAATELGIDPEETETDE
jgi:hypothetical protein